MIAQTLTKKSSLNYDTLVNFSKCYFSHIVNYMKIGFFVNIKYQVLQLDSNQNMTGDSTSPNIISKHAFKLACSVSLTYRY